MLSILRFFSSAQFSRTSRAISSRAVVSHSWLLAVLAATTAYAVPPVASNDLSAGEKVGVTLYQVNGLKGSIPLKKVYKVDPSGDSGHYELQFASSNMNTEMQIMAKYVVPAGMTFKSFEVRTTNGPTQVTPAGADSWDGKIMIDKVTVSPWNMSRVLQQCVAHLQNGDGTFKDSATFDLEADSTEEIRGKGIATPPNAPPGSASSATGTMQPRTRITAYIVAEERKGSDVSRGARRVEAPRPSGQATSVQPTIGRVPKTPAANVRLPVATPQPQRVPQRISQPIPSTRLTNPVTPMLGKDRFERTKPHVNAPVRPQSPDAKSRVPGR